LYTFLVPTLLLLHTKCVTPFHRVVPPKGVKLVLCQLSCTNLVQQLTPCPPNPVPTSLPASLGLVTKVLHTVCQQSLHIPLIHLFPACPPKVESWERWKGVSFVVPPTGVKLIQLVHLVHLLTYPLRGYVRRWTSWTSWDDKVD
jgi:hypothetical protein